MTTPAPPTATLAAWLEQQLAADEALATAATAGPWEAGGMWWYPLGEIDGDGRFVERAHGFHGVNAGTGAWMVSTSAVEADAAHIAAQDPAQTHRRVAAIRRIIDLRNSWADQADRYDGAPDDPFTIVLKTQVITADTCLRTLASQFADRDGYRAEEWA